jgi:hypothetical protein
MALTFADALRLAAKDPKFAADLVQNPDAYKVTFGMSDQEVQGLKNASLSDVLTHGTGQTGPAVYFG